MSEAKTEHANDPEQRRSRFSGLHARTFEMELLLSGAVVFGLIHLPPIVERFFSSYRASLEGDLRWVGVYGQVYLQLVLYALIAAFVLHLAMRGFWIGLLGLESVYPDGIRWDRLKLGRLSIERFRQGIGSLARAVEKADDLCSLVFSFAFMVVFTFLYSVVVLGAAAGFAVGFSRLLLGGEHANAVFWVFLIVVVGGQMVGQVLDKRLGPYLRPGGLAERALTVLIRFAWVVSPMRFLGAIQLTLQSNLSTAAVGTLLMVGMIALVVVQVGGTIAGSGVVRLDSLVHFPDSLREQGIDPRHYRTLRDPGAVDPSLPTIQGDVVTEPYLKLFLPYYPRRHNHLVAEVCPDLDPISDAGFDAGFAKIDDALVQEAAACLGNLFQISLDGEVVEDLHFDFTREPSSDLEGVVSFLPLDSVEPGRHELEIIAPPRREARDDEDDPPASIRHVIPFWR